MTVPLILGAGLGAGVWICVRALQPRPEPISAILARIANKERRVAEMTGGKFDSELMVVADRTTPYRLLTEVLYSCGQAGYSNYRLVVLKNSE